MGLFRKLSREEEDEYIQWARDHWEPGKPARSVWHPTIVGEWNRITQDYLEDELVLDALMDELP